MDHFSLETENVHPIKIIDKENFNQWNEKQSSYVQNWVKTNGFKGALFDFLIIPSKSGSIDQVLFGWGENVDRCEIGFILQKLEICYEMVLIEYHMLLLVLISQKLF